MDPRTLRDKTVSDLQDHAADLRKKMDAIGAQVSALSSQMTELQSESAKFAQHLSAISAEIERRTRPALEPRISDHALLRYIERVHGVDLEELRAVILTPSVRSAIIQGASAVIVSGVKFVIKDGVIVTALNEGQRVKQRDRKGVRDVSDDMQDQIDEFYAERSCHGA